MFTLEQIPMREDNYTYAIIKDSDVWLIDPSEADQSAHYFKKNPHLTLRAVFNTHSHWDHVGGNEILAKQFGCPVYGPALEKDRVPAITNTMEDKQTITCHGLTLTAFDVKAHTQGHMALLPDTPFQKIIKHGHKASAFTADALSNRLVMFVGDSLFAAGCGRLFEGTWNNLLDSLQFYASVDPTILMACAHEYTQSNLEFARTIFPNHSAIQIRSEKTPGLLQHEGASIPCTFAEEHDTNPFLLALRAPFTQTVAHNLKLDSDNLLHVIEALRKAKDAF